MDAVKEVALVTPAKEIARADMSSALVQLASDPNFNPATLQALIAMHERAEAKVAEEAFNSAMSKAQKDMRQIAADANNPQTKSRYASYGAIDKALRPIYTDNGFALSFDTGDAPLAEWMRILCLVSHKDGFSRTYHVDLPADGKGAKGGDVMTKTHAVGAGMSYGMRYLVKMIFNVAVGEDDRDGNDVTETPHPPKDFERWKSDMESAAMQGTPALSKVWFAATPELRFYAEKYLSGWLAETRKVGREVSAKEPAVKK